jgi:CBS domain containing-hemolysin-like protein
LKTQLVKDLMVPLSEYATVSKDATLGEAVMALKESQAAYDPTKYPHRAILVFDERKHIIGKIDLICVLRALEPKYDEMISDKRSMHLGFTRQFQKAMLDQLKLWEAPMEDICKKASNVKVEKFMVAPVEGEYIEKNASLNEAIHQIVLGHHQSLMVTEGKNIVGVLRLTDVFTAVSDTIMACEI